jgi:threonine dehydrogenase-like Zn-dependent dehydrogenase
MWPYSGGQAEYLRVPYGEFNCLVLPLDAEEKQNDYVMLSDIFPRVTTRLNLLASSRKIQFSSTAQVQSA